MSKTFKDLFIITLFTLITTFLIWLPHYLALPDFLGMNYSQGFNVIYRNFDGLEYIAIAKTAYIPGLLVGVANSLSANYYASHFPGYPILIYAFAPLLGFLKSMLFVSLMFTVFSAWAFYFLVRDFKLTSSPLFLSIVFLILPARWLIVRSVGTSEPMFAFFVITSLYFFLKAIHHSQAEQQSLLPIQKFTWLAAIFGSLAQLTRPPGDLLTIAYFVFIVWTSYLVLKTHNLAIAIKHMFSFYPLFLMPLTILGIFVWFQFSYNDFWAYFHSGDNIHLNLLPFSVFNKDQYWVGSIWLEDVIYTFMLGYLAAIILIKRKLYPLAFFVFTYIIAASFVAHRDISRYTLPVVPFALIAFEKILVSKEFKIVLVILALAIYLYSQNFILANTAPVPNLVPYN